MLTMSRGVRMSPDLLSCVIKSRYRRLLTSTQIASLRIVLPRFASFLKIRPRPPSGSSSVRAQRRDKSRRNEAKRGVFSPGTNTDTFNIDETACRTQQCKRPTLLPPPCGTRRVTTRDLKRFPLLGVGQLACGRRALDGGDADGGDLGSLPRRDSRRHGLLSLAQLEDAHHVG